MNRFLYDIQIGIFAFPLVALVLALPYALYQYRRFGAISIWKTFVVFTFILYCMCAISLVVFPLPADHSVVVSAAQTPQLHPFYFVDQINSLTNFDAADRSTWIPTLKSAVAYEALFNVLLTVPLGAYLCYLFRCPWWLTFLIGLATTLTFETSQLTGLFGLYDHPYRLFDVDDIILNTTGTMLGFWLAIPFAWALPSMDEINQESQLKGASRVTFSRRVLAGFVDLVIFAAAFLAAWVFAGAGATLAKNLAANASALNAQAALLNIVNSLAEDPAGALLYALVIGAVLYALLPTLTKGRSIGKAIVGIRIAKVSGTTAPLYAYWVRFGTQALLMALPLFMVALAPDEIEGVRASSLDQIVLALLGVWALTVVARAIMSAAGYSYVSLPDLVSGTRLTPSTQVSSEEVAAEQARSSNGVNLPGEDAVQEQAGFTKQMPSSVQAENAGNTENFDSAPGHTVAFKPAGQQLEEAAAFTPGQTVAFAGATEATVQLGGASNAATEFLGNAGDAATVQISSREAATQIVDAGKTEVNAVEPQNKANAKDSVQNKTESTPQSEAQNKAEGTPEFDSGKQAALDSLSEVNYDQTHRH